MAANHAMSAFTHSLLSTPRNPRTQLPADRAEREGWNRAKRAGGNRSSCLSSSLTFSPGYAGSDSRPRVFTSEPSRERGEEAQEELVRPHTAPPIGAHTVNGIDGYLESEGNLHSHTGSQDETCRVWTDTHHPSQGLDSNSPAHMLDYPALFATLLESNALLRDEINDLRDRHTRTADVIERLRWERKKDEVSRAIRSGEHHKRRSAGTVTAEVGVGALSGARSSARAPQEQCGGIGPPQHRQDAWMQTDPPLCVDHKGQDGQSSAVLAPHSQPPAQLCAEQLDNRVTANGLSTAAEIEVQDISCDDESDLELNSVSSAHDIAPRRTSSSSSFSSSCSTADGEEDEVETHPVERSLRENGGACGEGDPFASPGVQMVGQMWDNFSVEDYTLDKDKPSPEGRRTETKEWTPRITIPRPFSMSLREAKSPKRKSRSLMVAEQERVEREAREEAELRKKFRATPIPASTFLPLYELINAQNEQRRLEVKQRTKEILHSTERPFSFTKREEEKKCLEAEAQWQRARLEAVRMKEEQQFRAKPFPKELFDACIDEEIKEREEYRRIRIEMRAREQLANSRLPSSMQVRGREYTVGSLRRRHLADKESRAFVTGEHNFQPRVADSIPDHDRAYVELQRQLEARKSSKQTTAARPFHLRTQSIPSRKEKVERDMKLDEEVLPETRWPFVAKRTKVPRQMPRSKSSPYPVQMTEMAKVRQSLTREKLAQELERERRQEEEEGEKREQRRSLRKEISQKSLSHDPTAWLEERNRKKLQEFRRQDREQEAQYHSQLGQMRQRVEARPLLLEKSALDAARQSAEVKYEAALKSAGLSEEEIQALSKDGEK